MNYYYNLLIIVATVFWTKSVEISATAETPNDDPPLFNFYVKSKGSGQKEITDNVIESVRILSGDTITFRCTTTSVHLWDGKIDHGKFLVGMKRIRRNSTGHFSSSLILRLRESPIQDLSIGFTQNYVKCFELDKEKRKRATCIYLNAEQDRKSHLLVNANENGEEFSVSLYSCPQITVQEENEFSQGEIPGRADIPEWLWNSANNSVLCQVEAPSRMKLKSVYCENPSWCNLMRYCTVQTCPSFVAFAPPCENLCKRQAMQVNFFSGQLQCEANGFSTNLNFVKGFNYEMCYFKPHRGVSFCQVLDLEIPEFDIFHGQPMKLYGRASKFVIIQNPEVHIILSNGQVIKQNVHIVAELKHHRKYPYFVYMINATANSKTKLIKVIGHRYDSNDLVVINKKLNVKVGLKPEITGLPTWLKLTKSQAVTVLPFTVIGFPDPEFVLTFNGVVVKSDPRFGLFKNYKGHNHIKIQTMDDNFFGPLKISASNIFGQYDFTIDIKDTTRMTRTEVYGIAAILACWIILIHYLIIKGLVKLYGRFCRRPIAVQEKSAEKRL